MRYLIIMVNLFFKNHALIFYIV